MAKITKKKNLTAQDADTAPTMWPKGLDLDGAIKEQIRDALTVTISAIRTRARNEIERMQRLYPNNPSRCKGMVLVSVDHLLMMAERVRKGEPTVLLQTGWWDFADAATHNEREIAESILANDPALGVGIMLLYERWAENSDDVPVGHCFVLHSAKQQLKMPDIDMDKLFASAPKITKKLGREAKLNPEVIEAVQDEVKRMNDAN